LSDKLDDGKAGTIAGMHTFYLFIVLTKTWWPKDRCNQIWPKILSVSEIEAQYYSVASPTTTIKSKTNMSAEPDDALSEKTTITCSTHIVLKTSHNQNER